MRIFHIAKRAAFDESAAEYRGDTLESEGFIHCSEAHQVMGVLDAVFLGSDDLVLLEIDPKEVGPEIRYENLEGGSELFPHIYGPLNREAVVGIHALSATATGEFRRPSVLST